MKGICSRPNCSRAEEHRGLCKHHYPIAYPAHLRGYADPARAREHLAALRARGMTKELLAQQGVTEAMIQRIQRRKQNIRKLTEVIVLAVPLPTVWVPSKASVDATGTTRRIQALCAIGYTQQFIGESIGMDPVVAQRRIASIRGKDRIAAATAAKVAELYEQLQLTIGPSIVARQRAQFRGWVPPLAWDEHTIDDPAAVPDVGDQPKQSQRSGDEFAAIVADHRELGRTDAQIAVSLGYSKLDSFHRQLCRNGIPMRCIAS